MSNDYGESSTGVYKKPNMDDWDFSNLTDEQSGQLREWYAEDPTGVIDEFKSNPELDAGDAVEVVEAYREERREELKEAWDEFIDNMFGDMGPGKLFWPEPVFIGPVPVNVLEQEIGDWTAKATKYALEDGEPVSDHIHRDPPVIKLKIVWASDILLHKLYYEALKFLHIKRVLIPYISLFEIQFNMAIIKLSVTHHDAAANAYYATVHLQKIKFATAGEDSEGDQSDSENPETDPSTGEPVEGEETNTSTEEPGEEQSSSWIEQAADWWNSMRGAAGGGE